MADLLVKATLLRDHRVGGTEHYKGDEVEVTPTEERWGRFLGVFEGGIEEGEALGGPDPTEHDYPDHEDGDAGLSGIVPEDQQVSGEEAEEEDEGY